MSKGSLKEATQHVMMSTSEVNTRVTLLAQKVMDFCNHTTRTLRPTGTELGQVYVFGEPTYQSVLNLARLAREEDPTSVTTRLKKDLDVLYTRLQKLVSELDAASVAPSKDDKDMALASVLSLVSALKHSSSQKVKDDALAKLFEFVK